MSSSPCCSLFFIQKPSQHALESHISHRPYKSQFLGLRLKMWPYFLTYKCHRLSILTSTCDTLYGKHIFLLPSAPFLGPCGQIDRSKKEQRDLVALNFFTRHDLYSWKSFIDRYFHFFSQWDRNYCTKHWWRNFKWKNILTSWPFKMSVHTHTNTHTGKHSLMQLDS